MIKSQNFLKILVSTVVECLTHYYMFKGLSPAATAGSRREEMAKTSQGNYLDIGAKKANLKRTDHF
jgi:hypothetical protein